MKTYQTPEIVMQNTECEDIMTGSGETQSYFAAEGTDNLSFTWGELGIGG